MSINQAEDLRAMIDFARRWLPYGGGPDDEILVTFGIPGHQFHDRLARFLDSRGPGGGAGVDGSGGCSDADAVSHSIGESPHRRRLAVTARPVVGATV